MTIKAYAFRFQYKSHKFIDQTDQIYNLCYKSVETMYKQFELHEMPPVGAFGQSSNNDRIKPISYHQINYFSNNNGPIQHSIPNYQDDRPSIDDPFFSSAYQHQLATTIGNSIERNISFQTGQNVIYYGDLNQQTCTNLKKFVKQPKEKHYCIFLLNLVFWAIAITGITLISLKIIPIWFLAQFVGLPFLMYFIFTVCNNTLRPYFINMRQYGGFQELINKPKQKTGHIKFTAECYHFQGRKHRRKNITHTAHHIIFVRQCVDACENIVEPIDNNKYVLYKIKKYFYFGDQNSHNEFTNAFNIFKDSNFQDTHQTYSHSLEFTDFTDDMGFGMTGAGKNLNYFYYVFLLLGLGWPYLIAIEYLSQRYTINLTKRLTL